MSATYYIKAYFTKQDQQQPEIRRFPINTAPENDAYNELQTKVASFQSNAQLNDFSFQYNDEENERITFSSDDELRSAIALNKDGNTLKVFVTLNQSTVQAQITQEQQQQDDTINKERHVGVRCDGCQGPVIGFRYKCFVCPDYDLCEKCSAAGIHSEHNMIKITKPGNFQFPNGPHHPAPHHGFHHHPHGHFRHPHPHGPPHHPHVPPHHPHAHGRRHRRSPPPPPFTPNGAFLEHIQAQIPQWLPNRENTAHIRSHIKHHIDSLKTNTEAGVQNSKQYLESVGQFLQQTLSPFGIDCDFRVDEHNQSTAEQQQQQQEEQTVTTEEDQVTTTTTTTEEENTTTTEEEPIATDYVDAALEFSAVPKYPILSEGNNIDNEQSTASISAPPPPSADDESTEITNPIEKLVDDCMERMKAMGFIDANGALRELVRSKQGDINAVLDAINPRHFQA